MSQTQAIETAATPTTNKALQAFGDFLVQGVAGTMTSFFRIKQEGLLPNHVSDTQWKRMVTVQFIQYLNECWMSLLRNDDAYEPNIRMILPNTWKVK